MPRIKTDCLFADKAYDAEERVLNVLEAEGIKAVVPTNSTRLTPRSYDAERSKDRHLIENFFLKLKHFRAIATPYDKTACTFLAAIHLAAAVILLA